VSAGAVLVGAHVQDDGIDRALATISSHGAADVATVSWPGPLA
jgi:hypothetical protein